MAAWLSSTGISPSRGSRATLPIACDASPPDKWLHARTVAVRESHCPVGSYRPQAATPALRPCVSRSLPGEVMAHFPPGSSPTDRIRLPYAAGNFPPRLSLSKSPATYEERGGLVCASGLYISLKPRIEIISLVSSLLRSSSST